MKCHVCFRAELCPVLGDDGSEPEEGESVPMEEQLKGHGDRRGRALGTTWPANSSEASALRCGERQVAGPAPIHLAACPCPSRALSLSQRGSGSCRTHTGALPGLCGCQVTLVSSWLVACRLLKRKHTQETTMGAALFIIMALPVPARA